MPYIFFLRFPFNKNKENIFLGFIKEVLFKIFHLFLCLLVGASEEVGICKGVLAHYKKPRPCTGSVWTDQPHKPKCFVGNISQCYFYFVCGFHHFSTMTYPWFIVTTGKSLPIQSFPFLVQHSQTETGTKKAPDINIIVRDKIYFCIGYLGRLPKTSGWCAKFLQIPLWRGPKVLFDF